MLFEAVVVAKIFGATSAVFKKISRLAGKFWADLGAFYTSCFAGLHMS